MLRVYCSVPVNFICVWSDAQLLLFHWAWNMTHCQNLLWWLGKLAVRSWSHIAIRTMVGSGTLYTFTCTTWDRYTCADSYYWSGMLTYISVKRCVYNAYIHVRCSMWDCVRLQYSSRSWNCIHVGVETMVFFIRASWCGTPASWLAACLLLSAI